MGYFQVRYDSRGVNYDRRGFIRLATGCRRRHSRTSNSRTRSSILSGRCRSDQFPVTKVSPGGLLGRRTEYVPAIFLKFEIQIWTIKLSEHGPFDKRPRKGLGPEVDWRVVDLAFSSTWRTANWRIRECQTRNEQRPFLVFVLCLT